MKDTEIVFAILAVWSISVAKPLLDVLSGAPAYWVANGAGPLFIVFFALAVSAFAPLGLAALIVLAGRARSTRWLALSLFRVVFVTLATVAVYHMLSLFFGKSLKVALIAVVIAVATYWLFERTAVMRLFVSLFGVMGVILPLWFLILTPTKSLLSHSRPEATGSGTKILIEDPIVIIVFDEMNLPSLLGADGEIDPDLFPNFRRLAATSTWFRNATANYGGTEDSIPSLLTGRLHGTKGAATSYLQSPANLFTLFGASDGVLALESVTNLCPPDVKETAPTHPALGVRQAIDDMALIYANIMVPDRFASHVRPIPHRWRNLAATEPESHADTLTDPAMLLKDWFSEGRRRSIVYLHMGIPHAPYSMNPNGTPYLIGGDYRMLGWSPSSHQWRSDATFQTAQGFQRYLLQSMHADRVLGAMLEALETQGMMRDSTLIVTADHGVAFTPGMKRRTLTFDAQLVAENNSVPLFWKSPGQSSGDEVSWNVELVDVLPTLLESLGTSGTDMDGTPMFHGVRRPRKLFAGIEYKANLWPEILEARERLYAEIAMRRPDSALPFPVPARYSRWIGADLPNAPLHPGSIELDNPDVLQRLAVPASARSVSPNYVQGRLVNAPDVEAITIAVNSRIVDIVEVSDEGPNQMKFASVFDPSLIGDGVAEIAFYATSFDSSGEPLWGRLNHEVLEFSLVEGVPIDSTGRRLERRQARLVAAIDSIDANRIPNVFHISGWMGDRKLWTPPLAYFVSYGDTTFIARANISRPDLASVSTTMTNAGFSTAVRFPGEFDKSKLKIHVILDARSYAEMDIRPGMQ